VIQRIFGVSPAQTIAETVPTRRHHRRHRLERMAEAQ
jgi:hypothetical protein